MGWEECHAIGDTQLGGQSNKPVRSVHSGAGGTAGDQHPQVGDLGRRPQQHIRRLQRLDTTDERDHLVVLGQAQFRAGLAARAGREHRQIDTGVHHIDTGRVGAVQRNQLARLDFGVHDQPVGLIDDLLFTDRTQDRLGGVTFGKSRVLDRGQRMGGMHQRHRPAIGCQPPHLAGKPVVRMDDVVIAGLVGGLGAQHPRGERAQLGGQVVLVQPFEWARHDVAHQHPGRHLDHRLIRGGRGAGEDLDLDTAAGQFERGLQHVHVHSAGIAGTRLRQR